LRGPIIQGGRPPIAAVSKQLLKQGHDYLARQPQNRCPNGRVLDQPNRPSAPGSFGCHGSHWANSSHPWEPPQRTHSGV